MDDLYFSEKRSLGLLAVYGCMISYASEGFFVYNLMFQKSDIALLGTLFFFGRLLGNLLLSKHDGIVVMRFAMGITLISYAIVVYWPQKAYIPSFLIGVFSVWRVNLSYMYAQRMVPKNR